MFRVFAIVAAIAAQAYDIGCIYPEEMPDPLNAQLALARAGSIAATQSKMETPIVVHGAHLTTFCTSNCIAHHDAEALNVITKEPPSFRTPENYHNSWSRMLCAAQCWGMLSPVYAPLLQSWNFNMLPISKELIECGSEPHCVGALLINADWNPLLIAQIVSFEILQHTKNDGWNRDGSTRYNWISDTTAPCTANCAPYSDTSGYFPVNIPGVTKPKNKYSPKGNALRWQPILEHDGQGYFSRQEHVTPHIGYKVTPFLIKAWKKAPKPKYKIKHESYLVIKNLRELASDQKKKNKVEFMDNKLLVRGLIQHTLREIFADDQTFEDQMMFIHAISAAEYDAILQVWREKIRHDAVRPTTVIQGWGSVNINSFGGDRSATSPVNMKAEDFQAYIRVMPHSEYPSGSACLCTAYAEFTDLYVKQRFDVNTMGPLHVGPGMHNDTNDFNVCMGGKPCTPEQSFSLKNMRRLKKVCGRSRLWGGMHFSKSVSAAEELCSGIGALALELHNELKSDSDWGDSYIAGDSRPMCV